MPFHLATSDFQPSDRREVWHSTVARTCGPFVIDFGPKSIPFHGEMDTRAVLDLHCTQIMKNTVAAHRSRREVSHIDPEFYYLIMQVEGRSRVTQADGEAVLEPGEIALIDSSRPCAYAFLGDTINLNLHIPRALVDGHRGYRRMPVAETIRGPVAAITGGFIRLFYENAESCGAHYAESLREALTTVVLAALFGDDRPPASDKSLIPAVHGFIDRHLAEPGLAPAMIAAAHGISVRHLHRLFEPTGKTVGEWVREQRLKRCAADLRDATLRGVSVTEVCYRWGFSDSAHFSRAFKGQFGETPRRYRAQLSGTPPIELGGLAQS